VGSRRRSRASVPRRERSELIRRMYRETTIVVTAGTESEAGTVWRCLEYCWEVFLTKLIKQLPCYFWNFWLSAVRTTSKTTLALDGNTFVNFHSNLSSQEKHALALKLFRYASCPQPVRCEARNVGSGVLVPSIAFIEGKWGVLLPGILNPKLLHRNHLTLRLFLMELTAS